ncbi:hypothetical protein J5W63_06450 [Akkermansia massiliensis]|uniref:hypothetical protein n=4 Tax=Akkermansiaceae TaxID=1647988 RepID=UPI0011AF0859|nr:hypothetical protein [Akkermansia massiliensis]QWP04209.1 hypothetical protein J5W47_06460 [Akkermansia massiliensis]QWP22877.1 hypothetical protein J5W63_06450 [Akkermansia massiliensis]QWP69420.1 hypothetical protein J5W74_06450 [Akkermansia massiliensis]
MIVERSTGMHADSLLILHPVGDQTATGIPCVPRLDLLFASQVILCPGKLLNTFPAPEKNAEFPRFQRNELRKQFFLRKRLFVKIIPGFACLRLPGRRNQRRTQCHVETNSGKLFPFLHPDIPQYSQRILSRGLGKRQFFKHLRVIQQPLHKFLVLQFMKDVSPFLPHQRKKMGHVASLRHLPVLQQRFHGKRFFRLQFLLNILPAQPGNIPHIPSFHLPCQALMGQISSNNRWQEEQIEE